MWCHITGPPLFRGSGVEAIEPGYLNFVLMVNHRIRIVRDSYFTKRPRCTCAPSVTQWVGSVLKEAQTAETETSGQGQKE